MKQLTMCTALVIAVMLFAATAGASVVPFQWSTSGSFSGTHTGLGFSGFADSQSTPPSGDLNNIKLGTFTFDAGWFDYNGTFTLTVTFSRPNAVVGGPNETFTATYEGEAAFWAGSASVDFADTWSTFNYNGTDGVGSFDFKVDDVCLADGWGSVASADLTGDIRNAQAGTAAVPEPQSVLLLFTALAGVAVTVRKRFRK